MRGAGGLTLLEVIVAFSVMTIGILAAVALQASTLRTSREAQAIGQVTRMLSAELALQRHTANMRASLGAEAGVDRVTFPCASDWVEGIESCMVSIERCTIVDRALTCGHAVTSGPAYRIAVAVTGAGGEGADVTTVTTGGRFIAGAAGIE